MIEGDAQLAVVARVTTALSAADNDRRETGMQLLRTLEELLKR